VSLTEVDRLSSATPSDEAVAGPRVLICGLGSIGIRHTRNFLALGAEIVAGVDPSPVRAQRFEAETGAPCFATVDESIGCGATLAIVASPSVFHVDQATTFARAGLDLFIEKPLGSSLDGVADLIHEVRQRDLFAHVGSNWKFHPAMSTLKQLIDEGVTGPVAVAQIHAGQWLPDWHPWEDYRGGYSAQRDLGGGAVLDSHEFDCLTWLLGPVEELRGFTASSGALEIDTEDNACACLRFQSGALATIQIDYIQRDYRRRYHVSGPSGSIDWDFGSGVVTVYRAGDEGGEGRRETIDCALSDLNEMYISQSSHVIAGVRGDEPPVTSVAQAAEVLKLLLAVKGTDD